jgi:7-cyano-7-deazaguanine synthase
MGDEQKAQAAVVLLSGGVDSVTLLHHVVRNLGRAPVYALSFDYGQKHRRELDMAARQACAAGVAGHRVIDLSGLGCITRGGSALTDETLAVPDLESIPLADRVQPPTYVPNRNMVLLSLAAAYAESVGAPEVFYGAQVQDEYGYWDCTIDFVTKINDVLALNRRGAVVVRAPFAQMRKAEIIRIGLRMGVDYSYTWTCYRGGDTPCGTCPSCVERQRAFLEAERSSE